MSKLEHGENCSYDFVLAINDTMNVLSGKRKLPLIGSLMFGPKRFKNLELDNPSITPRMLSKELVELGLNNIVNRTVYDTKPVAIEYSLTDSGKSLKKVLEIMVQWGVEHRKRVMTN